MNTNEILVAAIRQQQNVSFSYQAHYRECSPHAIGHKKGKVNVLVYQFSGSTSKGPIVGDGPNNWRCMDVNLIDNIRVIEGAWHTFENHTRPSNCIDDMIEEVVF